MNATNDRDVDLSALADKLDAIDRKLDDVLERQRFLEDFLDEMTPVAREALGWGTEVFGEAERKGYFAVARELMAVADRVVETYGPGEVQVLGEHIVELLDTVRNLTQPDVLEVANDAADVLHHAEAVKPVGVVGVVRASGDRDVQRGMAMAVEILRHLGRARGQQAPPRRPTETSGARGSAPRSAPSQAPRAVRPGTPRPADQALHPPTPETVTWQGKAFTAEGFLLDADDWDEDLASAMAEALGVELTDEAWTVLRWARQDYQQTGSSPNVRRVATGSGVGTERMYALFPKSPGKTAAMLAGIPKPAGCV